MFKPARPVTSLALAAFAACSLFAAGAGAAPVLVGTAGNATGVSGLVVGTSVYNVAFDTRDYNTVYPANDAVFLGDLPGATDAADALAAFLNDQAVTGVLGFDCTGSNALCLLVIPTQSSPAFDFARGTGVLRPVSGASWLSPGFGFQHDTTCNGIHTGLFCYNPGITGLQALAVFDLVPPPQLTVPEPSVPALLAVAMAALGLTRKRRRH